MEKGTLRIGGWKWRQRLCLRLWNLSLHTLALDKWRGWDISPTATAEAAVSHAEATVQRMGRVPLLWKYDHGSAFDSKRFSEFLDYWKVIGYPIPARSPWVQGRVERDNQEIQNWMIPFEGKTLSDEQWEGEIDEGMFMLNFIKPHAVLNFRTSANVYYNSDGVEEFDRKWLRLNPEDLKCQLGWNGCTNNERLHRRAVRILLQKWGLYAEYLEMPKGAKIVNRSDPFDVSF